MARIASIEMQPKKPISIALTAIYGIGRVTAAKILSEVNVKPDTMASELKDAEVSRINATLEANYQVEGVLKQKTFRDVKRLKDIRAYRGIRHKVGLPVRGQNSRSNGRTRKGKNKAVGGLKRKIEKT